MSKPDSYVLRLSARSRPIWAAAVKNGALTEHWSGRNRRNLSNQGTFARAPLRIEDSGGGQSVSAGDLDVTTFMTPLVFRINRNGALRFHILFGPAYAVYRPSGPQNADASIRVFKGSRTEWGGAAG